MDHIAEQGVLGSLLIDAEIVPEVLSSVDPADFEVEINRRIFEAARSLYREGSPVDPFTVLGRLGLAESEETRGYVAELMEVTPSAANWREYALMLHEAAVLRVIQAQALLLAGARTLDDCRAPIAALGNAINAGRRTRGRTLSELLTDFARRQAETEPPELLTFGVEQLDKLVKLPRGKVLVISGLPSDGKTAFALIAAVHMAKKYRVGFFSIETDGEDLVKRIVASGWQIDYARIMEQKLVDTDWISFNARLPEFAGRSLVVFDEGTVTADQIMTISRAYDFDAVFIDYVQMVETEKQRGTTRAEQLAEVSRALHAFARSTDTLVVELAQRKQPDARESRAPDMFDLAESSQFNKDADAVLMIYRPGPNDRVVDEDEGSKRMDYDKTRLLKIAKNKNGKRGKLKLAFDGEHQSFYILGREPAARRPSDRKKKAAETPGQQALPEVQPEKGEVLPF